MKRALIIAVLVLSSAAGADPVARFKSVSKKSRVEMLEERLARIEALLTAMARQQSSSRRAMIQYNECNKSCQKSWPWHGPDSADEDEERTKSRQSCFDKCEMPIDAPGGTC